MYNETASGYDELHKEEQLKKLNLISKYLNVKKTDRLLDIGCGTGISTNYFKCSAVGIDNSEEMIKNGKGNLIHGKAEKLPFGDNSFDIILCITAVHHFKLNKFIEEVKKIIKQNGKIAITILKKSPKLEYIRSKLIYEFSLLKEINESKDLILMLEPYTKGL